MIAITSIVRNSDGSWTFSWMGTGSWRVVLYGTLLAQVTNHAYNFKGQGYGKTPPPLEITLPSELALSEKNLPFVVLQWITTLQAANYLVQHYTGTSWNTVANVHQAGRWYYSYQSPILKDETQYNYQVLAVDKYGDAGLPRAYQKFIVRPPDPPKVKIDYTNPNVIVSAPS